MTHKFVIFLPPLPEAPALWCTVSNEGNVLQTGILNADEVVPYTDVETIAVVPATDVAIRWLKPVKGSRAQIKAAALWQMADAVGHDLSDSLVVVGELDDRGEMPVCAVSRSLLLAWNAWLDGAGVKTARIIPDALCVPRPDEGQVAVIPCANGDVLLRGQGLSVRIQPELVDALVGERNPLDFTEEQGLSLLAVGAASTKFELGEDRRSYREAGRFKRLAVLLAAALLVSPFALIGAEIARNELDTMRALDEASALAVAYSPDAAGQADPLSYFEKAMAERPPEGGHVRSLAALAMSLESQQGSVVREIEASTSELRGVLQLSEVQQVQPLQTALDTLGYSLQDCVPVAEDNAFTCRFSIRAVQ